MRVCVVLCVNTYREVPQNGLFSPHHFGGKFYDVYVHLHRAVGSEPSFLFKFLSALVSPGPLHS